MGRFSGKNTLVVGGSSGIGFETTKSIIEEGGNVFVASRTFPEQLRTLSVTHLTLDVSDSDFTALDSLPEQLDGFVYCPGTINLKPFSRLSADDFKNDFQVNVLGAVQVLQFIIPRLKKSPTSSVIFYSTVASSLGMPFHASVAASKSALEGLSISLAAEYAQNRIRFNVIAPSLTRTPLAAALLSTPEKQENSNKRHPLGRIGEPDEIAALTLFLLSDDSSWMTGQVLHSDGGLSSIK